MLPRKSTIKKALEAAEEELIHGSEFEQTSRRINAIKHVLITDTPYIPIIKEYPSQEGYIEKWES